MRHLINLVESMQTGITEQQLRAIVPPVLESIPTDELLEAFAHFVDGHSLDNVTVCNPRVDIGDALTDMQSALKLLACEIYDGKHIAVYRTVEYDSLPDLSQPSHLGIYWSANENHTMGYEDDSTIMFQGRVEIEAVNWGETIPLFYDCHESEIRLHHNAKIEDVTCGAEILINPLQYA